MNPESIRPSCWGEWCFECSSLVVNCACRAEPPKPPRYKIEGIALISTFATVKDARLAALREITKCYDADWDINAKGMRISVNKGLIAHTFMIVEVAA